MYDMLPSHAYAAFKSEVEGECGTRCGQVHPFYCQPEKKTFSIPYGLSSECQQLGNA